MFSINLQQGVGNARRHKQIQTYSLLHDKVWLVLKLSYTMK